MAFCHPKNKFNILILLVINLIFFTNANSKPISNIVGPYIIPNHDRSIGQEQIVKETWQKYSWPQSVSPENTWWVPLELNESEKDVIEAIVSPWLSLNLNRAYGIEIGNQRKDINDEEINIAKAVGRLVYRPQNGTNWTCTATHVGNGYVVTAGHCVADAAIDQEACSSLFIEWDYRKSRNDLKATPKPTIIGKCQKIISWEFRGGDAYTIDHAIIKVDNAPDNAVAIDPQPLVEVGSTVHQFSHPGGVPLLWANQCKITQLPFQYYRHDCFSASGSSGSALIDFKTNKLIGVLSMGRDKTNFSVRNDLSPIGCFDILTGEISPSCKS